MSTIDDQAALVKADLLVDRGPPNPRKTGEYGYFHVKSGSGQVLLVTEEQPLTRLQTTVTRIRLRSDRTRRVRLYFNYVKYRLFGQPTYKLSRMMIQPTYSKGYVSFIIIPALVRGLARSVRIVRTSARSWVTRKRSRYPAKSTTLRPNPEVEYGTFLSYAWDAYSGTGSGSQQSYYAYYRTWTGVRTPGYGKMRRSELPVNPHSVSLRISHTKPQMYTSVYVFGGVYWNLTYFANWAYGPNYWTDPPLHTAKASNKAVRKLINGAGNILDANLAQDLSQISQTTRLITNNLARITKSAIALKKGNFQGAVSALWQGKNPKFRPGRWPPARNGSLANNWLELQYGWKPLIQDVKGSIESTAEYYQQYYGLYTASATGLDRSMTETELIRNGSWPLKVGMLYEYQTSVTKYTMRYKIQDQFKAFLAQTGFTNPLNLAWEVLPFSFVVDWFLPIGPYLESLSAWDGLEFIDGCKVQFTRRRRIGYMFASSDTDPGYGPGHACEYKGRANGEGISFDRTKLSSFPSLSKPQFKNPFSATHALNALALAKAIFGGR